MRETKQKRFNHPILATIIIVIVVLGGYYIFWMATHQTTEQDRFFNQLFTENLPNLFEEKKLDRDAEFDVEIEYFEKRNGQQITTDLVKGYYTTVRAHVIVTTEKSLFAFNGTTVIYDFRFAAMYEMNEDSELKLASAYNLFHTAERKDGELDEKEVFTNYRCPEYAGENETIDPKTGEVAKQVFNYLVNTGQMITRYELEKSQ